MKKNVTKITTTRTEITLDESEIEQVLLKHFELEGGHIAFECGMGMVNGVTIYGSLEEEEDIS